MWVPSSYEIPVLYRKNSLAFWHLCGVYRVEAGSALSKIDFWLRSYLLDQPHPHSLPHRPMFPSLRKSADGPRRERSRAWYFRFLLMPTLHRVMGRGLMSWLSGNRVLLRDRVASTRSKVELQQLQTKYHCK